MNKYLLLLLTARRCSQFPKKPPTQTFLLPSGERTVQASSTRRGKRKGRKEKDSTNGLKDQASKLSYHGFWSPSAGRARKKKEKKGFWAEDRAKLDRNSAVDFLKSQSKKGKGEKRGENFDVASCRKSYLSATVINSGPPRKGKKGSSFGGQIAALLLPTLAQFLNRP